MPTEAVDRLEATEAAHIACRLAWLYPEHDDLREAAGLAVALVVGVGYLDLVARKLTTDPGLDMDDARRAVAEDFRRIADRVYSGEAC